MRQETSCFEVVLELVRGRSRAEMVAELLRLGVPDRLGAEPVPAAGLARGLGVGRRDLLRLLRRAAHAGLLAEGPTGSFRGTPASALLRSDGTGALHAEARHVLSEWTRLTWEHLEHSVRTGRSAFAHATGTSVFAYLRDRPEEAEAFHTFQVEVTRRNLRALHDAGCLPGSGTVVDVGGGEGALLAAVVEASDATRGVLFDLPEVIARARRTPRPPAVARRLRLVEGDFFAEVPAGGDVYVLSHILHDWPDARAGRILDRVAAAMTRRARLLVIENVLPALSPPDLVLAYLDVQMLAAWEGRERTIPAYGALLRGAGLHLAAVQTADPRRGLTVLTATR
jgi:hypothetical protein